MTENGSIHNPPSREISRGATVERNSVRQENSSIAGLLIGMVVTVLLGAFGVAWIVSYAGF